MGNILKLMMNAFHHAMISIAHLYQARVMMLKLKPVYCLPFGWLPLPAGTGRNCQAAARLHIIMQKGCTYHKKVESQNGSLPDVMGRERLPAHSFLCLLNFSSLMLENR